MTVFRRRGVPDPLSRPGVVKSGFYTPPGPTSVPRLRSITFWGAMTAAIPDPLWINGNLFLPRGQVIEIRKGHLWLGRRYVRCDVAMMWGDVPPAQWS